MNMNLDEIKNTSDLNSNLHCSFCGISQKDAKRLVASPDGSSFICNNCIKLCNDIVMQDNRTSGKSEQIKLHKPSELKKMLDDYVIGQDDAKRVLSVAVYNHYKRINYLMDKQKQDPTNIGIDLDKSNVLLIGPTGSGKTLLAKTLAKVLRVPFAQADATTLTETGYMGEDVESVLTKLVKNADYDIEKAQHGIVYIDEIDKLSKKSTTISGMREVGREGVQQALLKLMEGTMSQVPPKGGRKTPFQEMVPIDTTNILFIVGGSFVGLTDKVKKRLTTKGMGFLTDVDEEKISSVELIKKVRPDDLIQFGLIPEFVGRVPVIVGLRELVESDLVHILTEPKNAIVKQFEEMFRLDGIALEFTDDAILAIAQKAIELDTGARGLRAIIENMMLNTMFHAPNDKALTKIVVDKRAIETGEPTLVRVDAENFVEEKIHEMV